MPKGLLELSGTIDLSQFWPTGESDADTVKVKVAGVDAFRFRPNDDAPMNATHAFNDAVVKGQGSKPCIDKNGRVTIRLQGIDAPELHYLPTAPTLNKKKPTDAQKAKFKAANGNFRQHLGETAAMALGKFLTQAGTGTIDCVVRTAVDEPSDVFDMFGRFIGSIIVDIGGAEQDANLWLCRNGWAYPTFYSSMNADEITELLDLAKQAKKAKLGIWKSDSSDLNVFDDQLRFRDHGQPDPAADRGPVFMPKLFRRRSTYGVTKKAGMTKANFKAYLAMEPDACVPTEEFLDAGITAVKQRHLDEFVDNKGKFLVSAGDLVFQEGKSKVVGKDGKPAHW
ncbi:MAG TPA: thermonuclease family protein [Candidatus Cybelea sp.]|nr:thermonuclease family protein [Candidatus Cybelea sp.]